LDDSIALPHFMASILVPKANLPQDF